MLTDRPESNLAFDRPDHSSFAIGHGEVFPVEADVKTSKGRPTAYAFRRSERHAASFGRIRILVRPGAFTGWPAIEPQFIQRQQRSVTTEANVTVSHFQMVQRKQRFRVEDLHIPADCRCQQPSIGAIGQIKR